MWGFIFLLLAHAIPVFWLGDRSRARPVAARPEPFLFIPADQAGQQKIAERASMSKATLFALPSPSGFSGKAWLNFEPTVPELGNTTNAPQALPLPVQELGSTLIAVAETSRVRAEPLLHALRKVTPLDIESPVEPLLENSAAAIQGALAQRELLSKGPALPSVPHTELLTNTIIDLAVDADGAVETASLLGRCGLRVVDERALDWARTLRFARSGSFGFLERPLTLTRGRLVFTWHVVPPTATNGAGATL